MDYIIPLDDEQARLICKPFIDFMLERARLMFPDADFQYQPDEFVRDTPGKYELAVTWEHSNLFFIINKLELRQPLGLDTLAIMQLCESLTNIHPHWVQVVILIDKQIEVGQAEGPGPHVLRLTW